MITHCQKCLKPFTATSYAEGFCLICKANLPGVPEVPAEKYVDGDCGEPVHTHADAGSMFRHLRGTGAHSDTRCTLTASSVINTACASCRKLFEVPLECPDCESKPPGVPEVKAEPQRRCEKCETTYKGHFIGVAPDSPLCRACRQSELHDKEAEVEALRTKHTVCDQCSRPFAIPHECPECEAKPLVLALPLHRGVDRQQSVIYDVNGKSVVTIYPVTNAPEILDQILTAVNAHKDLVEACQRTVDYLVCGCRAYPHDGKCLRCVCEAAIPSPDRFTWNAVAGVEKADASTKR